VNRDFFIQSPYTAISSPDFELSFGHLFRGEITSRPPVRNGKLYEDRHIEVKGRAKGQTTITITANEIIYALNQKSKFILAVVLVDGDDVEGPFYILNPFDKEPDFGEESRNYQLANLLKRAVKPEQTLGYE
jgi:hypothetical protein